MRNVLIVISALVLNTTTLLSQIDMTDTKYQSMQYWEEWRKELNTPGMWIENDTLYISDEVKHMMIDETYAMTIYPEQYTSQLMQEAFNTNELKKGFWMMINLYPGSPEEVLVELDKFNALLPMDKLLYNAYQTYAFLDPEVVRMVNGEMEMHHPDLFETKLRSLRSMLAYLQVRRTEDNLASQHN